ncbi:MAG TPA: RdgB/HAM1 family non-canonical purine NTP pyrophosphatase [Nitrososphaerales archaeon]|nr:RdgB/HAM1 family non-canonical purine NTP pyrophosphatase [Nitrososphaerales archaeon]
MSELRFATSNLHKFEEATHVLRSEGIRVTRLPSKGTEIQSDSVAEIASLAAAEVYHKTRTPVFVEDTGLFVKSLGGFPGAYGAYVFSTIGLKGLTGLLERSQGRDAEFRSAVAYCDSPSGKPAIFAGKLVGSIAKSQRGSNGFGFDPIFIPEGGRLTLAEMTLDEKCTISHRSIALRAFATWFKAHHQRSERGKSFNSR